MKSPASFDPKKLQAFEDWHFQQLSPERKIELVTPFLEKAKLVQSPPTADEQQKIKKVIAAAGNRIKVAGDILEYEYLFLPDDVYKLDQSSLAKHVSTPSHVEILRAFQNAIAEGRPLSDDLDWSRAIVRSAPSNSIHDHNTPIRY